MRFSDPASPTPPGILARLSGRMATRGKAAIPRRRTSGLRLSCLGAAMLLGACTRPDAFAPACPQLAFLPEGIDLSRFAGSGRDLTDLVLDGHLTAVPAICHWANDSRKQVEAKLQVSISLNRGPAMRGRTAEVPYFVALTDAAGSGAIYDKQVYVTRAEFPPNTDRLGLSSPEISMLFPVSHEKSAAAYKITVSFQLTPEELAYNRTHAPR